MRWLQIQLGWRSTAAACITAEHKSCSPQRSQGSEEMDMLFYGHFVHVADEGILMDAPKKTVLPL